MGKGEHLAIPLRAMFARRLADAKFAESVEKDDEEYRSLMELTSNEPLEDITESDVHIKSLVTARAYGILEGFKETISYLEGRKFKPVDPPVVMNQNRLVAVNVLGEALYRGFIAGKPAYYILRPGQKAMSFETVDLNDRGWHFLDPNYIPPKK